jgi:hypothetical protein
MRCTWAGEALLPAARLRPERAWCGEVGHLRWRGGPGLQPLLIQKTDLPLADVLALDRVQKKLPIPDEAANGLRAGLIEGRKPNYHVAAQMAGHGEQRRTTSVPGRRTMSSISSC